jgi:FAD/FMN-containing dehydrogenase/Fe-S oxidoreductase
MKLDSLRAGLKGDMFTDRKHRILYATDGSAYRELPGAVVRPKDKDDIRKVIAFARAIKGSVIPRGAGTSLAGQVVGPGIVIDVSKYMNRIIEINPEERWAIVEPGVVLTALNRKLAAHGLMFGPETSTADWCTLGGMLGNNSCGAHSLIYGSVRDHILEADVILSDGTETTFRALTKKEFHDKCSDETDSLERSIYRFIQDILSDPGNQEEIRAQYPHPGVRRRNNGYALDSLLETDPFSKNGEKINLCRLLAGSEGTLAFTTRMKLNLIPVESRKTGLVTAHFMSLEEAVRANNLILKHDPAAIEMIDDFIVECTKDNIEQSRNRFFIKGKPKIILIVELLRNTEKELKKSASAIEKELRAAGYGYHFPLYTDEEEIKRIWDLRKAGLGVLLIIPGEKRSVQVIEDTAVLPEYFPDYIEEFQQILKKYNLNCAYYAHIATGELHLSPLLDLKDPADVEIYRNLGKDVAQLVKKYRGSLSGEHGDGRLRGEFIPLMLGDHIYNILRKLKRTWDPENVLNPGKIVDVPPMHTSLRYRTGEHIEPLDSIFGFPDRGTILSAAEKCSGSGDCRKSPMIGGTMCPTFMATEDEDKSTRGRANILREFLTRSTKKHTYNHREIWQVMDLCLSCKACKSECPSNVDMTKLKAEFLSHYYRLHGIPVRTLLVGWLPRINRFGHAIWPLTNFIMRQSFFKKLIGFTADRTLPPLSKITLRTWAEKCQTSSRHMKNPLGKVFLFADEFTNYNESDIGIKAIILLETLGYQVEVPAHAESGRTFLSKGLLKSARKIADKNVRMLKDIVTEKTPLVGIEPSAILTFRDEYPDLLGGETHDAAVRLGENAIMIEEFICREFDKGKITPEQFVQDPLSVKLHGHCQQKAIASTSFTKKMLSIPENFEVEEIPSGCCGMAGSFGYEKEHHELSMKIGEMVLFPAVRAASEDTVIAAPGTSCRCQIFDGTGKKALHPVEIMYDALMR